MAIRFLLNGEPVALAGAPPTTTLLDWLRETRGLTGTKEGCNEGDCGACTVAVTALEDGRPVHRALNACILLLPQIHGRAVRTVEGIAPAGGPLHPVQEAMVEHHGSQCGFCTPGIVMSLWAAGRSGRRDWDDVLAGNLCRCTGYEAVVRAAEAATGEAAAEPATGAAAAEPATGAATAEPATEPATAQPAAAEPAIAETAAAEPATAEPATAQPATAQPAAAETAAAEAAAAEPATAEPAAAEAATGRPAAEPDDAPALAALAEALGEGEADALLPTDLDRFADWYAANPDAVLVAGATDVGLWVNKGLRDLAKPAFLHRLDALAAARAEAGGLRIGAGVTIARLRALMAGRHPGFAELLRRYGSVQVRAAATLGGNIANASPVGDSMPALIALGATLTLRRGPERRDLALEDFFLGYGRQDRRPGEFVESVLVPDPPGGASTLSCAKVSKRFDQDISAVLGCFDIRVEEGRVRHARIAFGGMAAIPKRARAAEAALDGRPWTEAAARAGAAALAEDFTPISDMRASAGYRLRVAGNLLMRTWLETAGAAAPRLSRRGAA